MVEARIPHSLQEALIMMSQATYTIVNGATDLLVQKRSWSGTVPKFSQPPLYIRGLKELDYICERSGMLEIGATTSLETILHHPKTPKILQHIILTMASPAIRHQATLSGNIQNASPAGDSLVGLYLLDASIVLQNHHHERVIPIQDFIVDVRKTMREADELITKIVLPIDKSSQCAYTKVGPRKTDAIAKVAFGGLIDIENDRIRDIRIAFGAVYKTVLRSRKIEESLMGKDRSAVPEMKHVLLEGYASLIQPIDDQRSNRWYRKTTALNLLEAFLDSISR
ncbi:MAG: FAD binding domain-containing protein [Candidatus Izemoplasmatales bacterium]|nr:FAD binding domain-containing protein [Candidatus Izemoplasmatales bacterium]